MQILHTFDSCPFGDDNLDLWLAWWKLYTSIAQCADGESNKIVSEKKTAITAWMFNTYRVRNHLVPNPVKSKSIRLKKNLEKLKSKNHNIEKVRTNEKICMVQYWELPADWSISVSLNQQTIVLCLILLSKK